MRFKIYYKKKIDLNIILFPCSMPKGTKEILRNSTFGIQCGLTGTKRIFHSEKELKSYLKRHDKVCPCGKKEETGVVSNFGSRKTPRIMVNEL